MAFLDVEVRRDTIINDRDGSATRMDQSMRNASSLGIMKPGFTRLNLAYFMPDEEVEFILAAVNIVANDGWKLLPQYAYDVEHGTWQHRRHKHPYKLMDLDDITYNYRDQFHMVVKGNINPRSEPSKRQSFSHIMKKAKHILAEADKIGRELYPFDEVTMKEYLPDNLLPYVWWLEPQYAMHSLNKQSTKSLAMLRVASIPLKPRVASGPVDPQLSSRYAKFHQPKDHSQEELQSTQKPSDRVIKWVEQSSGRNVDYTQDYSENEPAVDNQFLYRGSDLHRKHSRENEGPRRSSSNRRSSHPQPQKETSRHKVRRTSSPENQRRDSKHHTHKSKTKRASR